MAAIAAAVPAGVSRTPTRKRRASTANAGSRPIDELKAAIAADEHAATSPTVALAMDAIDVAAGGYPDCAILSDELGRLWPARRR